MHIRRSYNPIHSRAHPVSGFQRREIAQGADFYGLARTLSHAQ